MRDLKFLSNCELRRGSPESLPQKFSVIHHWGPTSIFSLLCQFTSQTSSIKHTWLLLPPFRSILVVAMKQRVRKRRLSLHNLRVTTSSTRHGRTRQFPKPFNGKHHGARAPTVLSARFFFWVTFFYRRAPEKPVTTKSRKSRSFFDRDFLNKI
jgi:hypothetical protein